MLVLRNILFVTEKEINEKFGSQKNFAEHFDLHKIWENMELKNKLE